MIPVVTRGADAYSSSCTKTLDKDHKSAWSILGGILPQLAGKLGYIGALKNLSLHPYRSAGVRALMERRKAADYEL